ncbi:MAG TPA: ferritin-like fold-containing protein [Actinomycetaceae bacterium]|nr:ferritin-like fold-containing protein [Actinomycetaceae bacterium]
MITSAAGGPAPGDIVPPAAEVPPEAVRAYLGLLGYASLGSFSLLAHDAANSPDIVVRLRLSRMAAAELQEIDLVEALFERHGGDASAAVSEFAPILNDFTVRARPRDWWERLMRTYVGFNLLQDLLRELGGGLHEELREQVLDTMCVSCHADLVAEQLGPVLAADTKLASRLALWGRRVVGDAIGLVHRALAQNPALLELLPETDGDGPAREAALVGRLQTGHARRFARLGLKS